MILWCIKANREIWYVYEVPHDDIYMNRFLSQDWIEWSPKMRPTTLVHYREIRISLI